MDKMEIHRDTAAPAPIGMGKRHIQVVMMFLCVALTYSLRVNMSVAIVAMTDNKNSNPNFQEFDWNTETQNWLLSGFFWGYLLLQVPAGQVAEKYGAKSVLAVALLVCSLLTIATPYIAIHGGPVPLFFTRVGLGLFQGWIFPSVNCFLSKWAPFPERGRLFSLAFGGTHFGTLVTLPVAGLLSSSAGGWPSVFYVTGGCTLLWVLVWMWIGVSSPKQHSSIKESERNYIQDTLACNGEREKLKTPWRDILRSGPMWALLITHLGQNWSYWTLLTEMPSYINHVLDFDMKKNGFLSALPYFCGWIFTLAFSWISDHIKKNNYCSLTMQRKFWNSLAFWGGAFPLLVLAMNHGNDRSTAIFLLTLAVALNAAVYAGFMTNHLDLSPNFCGTLMGITNSLSNVTSIGGPLAVAFIVTDNKSEEQWKIVFLVCAVVMFSTNLIFIIFGTAKVQYWNDLSSTPIQQESNKGKSYSTTENL